MFVNLGAKSHFSLLASTLSPSDIVAFALHDGQKAAALVDENAMFGCFEFYKLCLAHELKPIIGLAVVDRGVTLNLIALNAKGYAELMAVSSQQMTGKPLALPDSPDLAKVAEANPWGFKENFHATSSLAWHAPRYRERRDARNVQVMRAVAEARVLSLDELVEQGDEQLLTEQQAQKRFSAEQMEALAKIVDAVDLKIEPAAHNIVNFPLPTKGKGTKAQALKKMCASGLRSALGKEPPEAYERRLDEEIAVIEKMGYEDYFLIVWDYVRWAREQGIMVGPGRGSVGGSLVAYALQITQIDPLEWNLLFERFLNTERVSLPDIDLDFMDTRRDEVINYLFAKYGKDHAAHITTFARMKAKLALRDVGRVLNVPLSDVEAIAKRVDSRYDDDLEAAIAKSEPLKTYRAKHPDLFAIAASIINAPRQVGKHAAGIVLSERPLDQVVPMQSDGETPMTQYSMEYLEELGLLKMDVLGLRNLAIIDEIVKTASAVQGLDVRPERIPLDDARTFAIIAQAKTIGIFQLESPGMRDTLVKVAPTRLEDVVAVISLFRPGPMANIPTYAKRKRGEDAGAVDLPEDIRDIVANTYGVIVYQEQVMQLAQKFAGFSLAKADIMRRAMGKKDAAKMEALRGEFVAGALAVGRKRDEAERVFELIYKFADYGFNRSHAVGYALVAYWMAYLKANFPLTFMPVLMTHSMGDAAKIAGYVGECSELAIPVRGPSVVHSDYRFVQEDQNVRIGLGVVKGFGPTDYAKVLADKTARGNYRNVHEAYCRLRLAGLSQRTVTALAGAGAFDDLEITRKALTEGIADLEAYFQAIKSRDGTELRYAAMPAPELGGPEYPDAQLAALEEQTMGFALTTAKADGSPAVEDGYDAIKALPEGKDTFRLVGRVVSFKVKPTKTGKQMGVLELADGSGKGFIYLFGSQVQKHISAIDANRARLPVTVERTGSGGFRGLRLVSLDL